VRVLILFALLSTAVAAAPPSRIISTAPGITEILFALGLGDRVVGVTEYCVYPPEAKKIRRTGSWMSPNMEAILTARPDLIIVQKTAIHDSKKFDALRLRTFEVQLLGVPDILESIKAIGEIAEAQGDATKLVNSLQKQLNDVRSKVAGKPASRTMFIVGRSPNAIEGIVAVGKNSYQHEMIELAGGKNIFADSPTPYPKVLHEEMLARDPEVIIDMGAHADATGLTEKQKFAEIALWQRFKNLSAVKNKRVYPVSSAIFVVPGPRVAELAREFARMLHPELFR
jgi:iron complex transport system substrate-binding protein